MPDRILIAPGEARTQQRDLTARLRAAGYEVFMPDAIQRAEHYNTDLIVYAADAAKR